MSDSVTHPQGEQQNGALIPVSGPVRLDTFGGRIHVEWNPEAAVTPLGQLPFFIDYLKLGGLFDSLGGELSAAVDEPQCAAQTRRARDRAVVDLVRSSALCPYQPVPQRWGQSRFAGHGKGGERGFGTTRLPKDG